jgi:predicted enzyme related to lactoylglutathione lyase
MLKIEDYLMANEITWIDLTVPNAKQIRDFYAKVMGWTVSEVAMGDYQDYCMNDPKTGDTIAGICHARGQNADLPQQWLIYFKVADLDKAMTECTANGGTVVHGPRDMGSYGRMCIIRDPSGAVSALIEPKG